MDKSVVVIARRKPLVKKLLLLDGIGRSGKFLAANILNGFEDVEPVQLCGLLEHIPYYEKLGLMQKRAAEELLHHEIDVHCYEMLIGRNLNHRIFDKSSIFNVAHTEAYLQRSKEENRDLELYAYYERGAYSLFIVHEVLPDAQIYFDAFPELKIISLKRSPLDIVQSWYVRDTMERWAEDPKFFNIPIEGKQGVMPWYMYEYSDEFDKLTSIDRIIFIIETLFKRYEEALKRFSPTNREKILFITYEDILADPAKVIQQQQDFLGKNPLPEMSAILTREKLPNPGFVQEGKEKKLAHIKESASPEYFERLVALERKYYAN